MTENKTTIEKSKAVEMYQARKGDMVSLENGKLSCTLDISTMLVSEIVLADGSPMDDIQLPTTGMLNGYMIGLDKQGNQCTGQMQLLGTIYKLAHKVAPKGMLWDELTAGIPHDKASQIEIKKEADKVGYTTTAKAIRLYNVKEYSDEQAKAKAAAKAEADALALAEVTPEPIAEPVAKPSKRGTKASKAGTKKAGAKASKAETKATVNA